MVPLEDTLAKPEKPFTPIAPRLPGSGARAQAAEPRRPRSFRVTDVLSCRILAENADARGTLDLLAGTRSIVDVTIDVWDPKAGRWRRLAHGENSTLWNSRHRPR